MVLVFLLTGVACNGTAYAGGPAGTERKIKFTPPVIYMQWWSEMEECSGKNGNFATVTWYTVPAKDLSEAQDGAIGLLWFTRRTAYIPSDYLWFKGVVQHEMLHALGFRGHPHPPFGMCAPTWASVPKP